MVSEHEIETKDFSCSLPIIIGKLEAALELHGFKELEKDLALYDLIEQSAKELRIIDDVLYRKGG